MWGATSPPFPRHKLAFCKDLEVKYLKQTIPPSLPVQDEVFEFPSVAAEHQDLDGRAITLVTGSSRKISVRLQRATTSQATQTEPLWHEPGWNDSGSHTFPKMKSKFHGKAGKNKGFAKWENEKPSVQADTETEAEAAQHIQDHNSIETLLERQESEVSCSRQFKICQSLRSRFMTFRMPFHSNLSLLHAQECLSEKSQMIRRYPFSTLQCAFTVPR